MLFLIIFTLLIYSCGKTEGNAPSSSLAPDPVAPPEALVIDPITIQISVNNTTTFTATGGAAPYSYSVFSGGGSILTTTGVYTAPAIAGSAVVRVTDALGQFSDSIVTISAALQISPTSQSLSVNQTHTFSTSGGVAPITYSIVSGFGSVNPSSGVYTASSSAGSAVVRATDSLGNTSEASVNVFTGLGISPNPANVSINQTVTFTAAGGSSPYTYSLVSGVGSINPSTGVYTAPAGTGAAVVRVTDSLSNTVDANVNIQNLAPVISSVGDQSANEDISWPINFTITDSDTVLNCASSMSATSSNTALLPNTNIIFSGTAPNCTVTLNPATNQTGTSSVQLTVTDGNTSSVESFDYTVNAVNDAPTISNISNQTTNEDTAVVVNFTVGDVDSTLNCSSSMSASTSTPALVPVSGIVFGGTAPNCFATVTPEADQNGSVNLTFRVSDSEPLHADQTFTLTVNAVNDAPIISNISNQSVKSDASININYTISDIDTALNCAAAITVSSANASVLPNADIAKSGTAPNCTLSITPSLNAAGTSTVTVTISDGVITANDTFDIAVINVTSLSVLPSSLTLAASATSQLSATASYSDSSTQIVTTSGGANWSSSNAAVAAVNNAGSKGLVTAVAAGSTNVSATYKGVTSNNSAITVISATSVTVSVGAVSGGVGSQRFISATAQNSSSTFDVTNTAAWSSSNSSVASVSNGVITFNSAGSVVVTVTYAGLSATVNVTVQSKSLVSIAVTGGASGVSVNGTRDLVATATYSDSSTENVTNSVVWSSTNTSVISVSNTLPNFGRITGLAAGSSNIMATIGSISGSQLVNVNSVTLSSIAVTPNDALVTSNGSYSLRAIATYSDTSTSDVTDLVTWASSNSAAATISNAANTKGVATTPNVAGYATTTITATLNAVVGTTPFGVNGSTILNILVTPIVTITPSSTYQLRAYANLSDGGTVDLTSFVVWTSSSVSNVTVSNSIGSKGLVTGIANGTSTITATFNASSGNRAVTVAGSSSLTEVGTGLLGSYYTWTGTPPPTAPFVPANQKGQRIDSRINFAWGAGNAPMGVGNQFAVRWTGFYKAISANNYFCTNSDDGVRVWINGVQVINNWTEHGPTWDCTANIALTAGTKYTIVIEYYENGGGSEMHFTRSSTSAADAQNTTTRVIPQNDLFHQ